MASFFTHSVILVRYSRCNTFTQPQIYISVRQIINLAAFILVFPRLCVNLYCNPENAPNLPKQRNPPAVHEFGYNNNSFVSHLNNYPSPNTNTCMTHLNGLRALTVTPCLSIYWSVSVSVCLPGIARCWRDFFFFLTFIASICVCNLAVWLCLCDAASLGKLDVDCFRAHKSPWQSLIYEHIFKNI